MVHGIYAHACVLFQNTEVLNGSTLMNLTSKNVTPLALPNASNANGKSLGYIRSRHVLIISVSDALCNRSPSSKNLSKGEPGGSGLIFSKERNVNCTHGGALFVPILNQ